MNARDIDAAASVTNAATVKLLDLSVAIHDGRENREMAKHAAHACGLAIVALQHVRPWLQRLARGRRG